MGKKDIYIPPIPAHVAWSHKNYEQASRLVKTLTEREMQSPPPSMTEEEWHDTLTSFGQYFQEKKIKEVEIEEIWDTTENYYKFLMEEKKEQDKTQAQKNASKKVQRPEKKEGKKEPRKERVELPPMARNDEARKDKKNLEKWMENSTDGQIYRNVVEAAISAALTRRGEKLEYSDEYKEFSSMTANIRDLARISEKHNFHPMLRMMNLYRTYMGERTAIRSVKQKPKQLFILIDDSGSMAGTKANIAKFLVLKAREILEKTGIDVFVYLFEEELQVEYNLKKEYPEYTFDQGGTDIQLALEQLSERIESPNASILIVNDGEDSVQEGFIPPRRTVALTMFHDNIELKDACIRSGGKYFHLK